MLTVARSLSRLVLIGSLAASVYSQGVAWIEITTKSKPPARAFHAMAYDAVRDRVVLFGGRNGNTNMGDTWEFDGTDWQEMKPTKSPGKRYDPRMVYDPIRKRVVLFGGQDRSAFADTWEWDGNNWILRASTTSPLARRAPSMFFDAKLGKIVLFGGRSAVSGTNFDDTWTWDGAKWEKLFPKSAPTARMGAPVDYDHKRGRAVMFGGWSGTEVKDTWEWDGSTWTSVATTSGPDERNDASIVALPGVAILFGGFGRDRKPRGGTWTFDGKQWSQFKLTKSPLARHSHRAVYDSKRSRILVFAGSNNWPSRIFNDLWSLSYGAATFTTFGQGCASTTVLPTISGTPPKLGQNFTLEIKGFLPKPQFGQVIFGASNAKWGLITLPFSLAVLGMRNCDLLVSLDTSSLIATDPQGSFKTTMMVPSSPSLLGATVYGQAWAPDPKSNYTGLAMTNGFKAVVGY